MDPLQFWSGVLAVVIVQLASVYINRQNNKQQAPVTNAQAEEVLSEAWERLAKEYARLLENSKKLEVENAELRPLVLKLALQEKDIEQTHRDKEDWKRYSTKLEEQLKDASLIPIPFRRYPGNGDSEKVKAITGPKIKAVQ